MKKSGTIKILFPFISNTSKLQQAEAFGSKGGKALVVLRDHRRDVYTEFFIKQKSRFGPGSNLGSTFSIAKLQHLVS